MAVMHSLANIVAFDASSCMYRYRAHSFLSLVTRPITILKTPIAAQWGCIRGCVSNGEARKKRGDWEGGNGGFQRVSAWEKRDFWEKIEGRAIWRRKDSHIKGIQKAKMRTEDLGKFFEKVERF